jgi:hypothetical protein
MWPSLATTLGVEIGADESIALADYIPAHAEVWEQVVKRHNLRSIPLAALLGESHFYADMCFAHGATASPPPIYVSTVKVRQHGFTMAWDTEQSFRHWLEDLIARRILPPATAARH